MTIYDVLTSYHWMDIDLDFPPPAPPLLFTMGAHNLKYFCLVKLFAVFEITSHLILDQLKLLFWQINYGPINHP